MTGAGVRAQAFDGSVFGVDEVGDNDVLFKRHTWLRTIERRLPRGGSARVRVQTCTIPPQGATPWRVLNGVAYSMVLAGEPVVHWSDGAHEPQPAGAAFTLDIGRVHRIENSSPDHPVVLLTLYATASDRVHVIAVLPTAAD